MIVHHSIDTTTWPDDPEKKSGQALHLRAETQQASLGVLVGDPACMPTLNTNKGGSVAFYPSDLQLLGIRLMIFHHSIDITAWLG